MKKMQPTQRRHIKTVIALTTLCASVGVHASILGDIGNGLKSVGNTITGTANSAADNFKKGLDSSGKAIVGAFNDVNGSYQSVVNTVNGPVTVTLVKDAYVVVDGGKQLSMNAADYAKWLAQKAADVAIAQQKAAAAFAAKSANIGVQEAASLAQQTSVTFSATLGAAQSAFHTAQGLLSYYLQQAWEELFRAAGKQALAEQHDRLAKVTNLLKHPDQSHQQMLNRVRRAIANRDFGVQTLEDMRHLALYVGLNGYQGSFGILVTGQAGLVAGGQEQFILAISTATLQPSSTTGSSAGVSWKVPTSAPAKLKMTWTFLQSVNGSVGVTEGASAGVGFMISPQDASSLSGASVGFAGDVDFAEGGNVGLSWNVSQGMSSPWSAVPSLNVGIDGGLMFSAAFQAGGTWQVVGGTYKAPF